MSIETDYENILQVVVSWPADQRLALAREIVASVGPRSSGAREPKDTANRAYGLLRTEQPPPTDDDVRRMLDEHRMEKYGR